MSRKLCLGNTQTLKLYEALAKSENLGYSSLCKDKIESGKSCHRRYGCSECRALEMSATGSISGMKFCSFLREGLDG